MKLGQIIERHMRDRGLSQKELSAKVGMSETSISLIINDVTFPKPETLKKIATALNTNVAMLFHDCIDINDVPRDRVYAFTVLWPHVSGAFKALFENPQGFV